jgi:hypothetical protein
MEAKIAIASSMMMYVSWVDSCPSKLGIISTRARKPIALIETLKNAIINENNIDTLCDEAVTIQSCFQQSASNVFLMQFCDVAKVVVIIDRNI